MQLPVPSPRPIRDMMIPLINVVFLLVIFFMLAGAMEAAPPFALQAPQTQQITQNTKNKTLIFMAADGRLAMPGGVSGLKQVLTTLKIFHSQNSDATIFIKADQQAPFSALKSLISALHVMGCKKISLLAAAK